jgi:hypothetical protein
LRDKSDIRRPQVELRHGAEGHLDADDAQMLGSGPQEVEQSRLQPIVFSLRARQSDNLSVVQLVNHRSSIEGKFLELLDSH